MKSSSVLVLVTAVLIRGQAIGNHPEWPRWCGKVYQPEYPSFDPGGQLYPPIATQGPPLLDVQFTPRYSLYLEGEQQGEFIITAPLSHFRGTPWPNTTNTFVFAIHVAETDFPLVESTIPVNTTRTILPFDLALLAPSLAPIELVLYGAPESGNPTWTATATLLYLPDKTTGSITRIDHLTGGLHHRNTASNHTFRPILPYGFFASYDGFLALPNATSLLDAYAALGLTSITPLTTVSSAPTIFSHLDAINLLFMYSLRDITTNLTALRSTVLDARDSEALYSYWLADEPDGTSTPPTTLLAATRVLLALDPYHPPAVVLNCANYYYPLYSSPLHGASILLTDPYPIGITPSTLNPPTNSTPLSKWNTPCTPLLGDCGCDLCLTSSPLDISARLDTYTHLDALLPHSLPGTRARGLCPQAFWGEGYWARAPSPAETEVMVMLGVNRGVMVFVAWVWPTTRELGAVHGGLAGVLGGEGVLGFLMGEGGPPRRVEVGGLVDVAVWVEGGRALVGVVNAGYVGVEEVVVPVEGAVRVGRVVWGGGEWRVEEGGRVVVVGGVGALGVGLVVVELEGAVPEFGYEC
ncbi:hypothetical protein QBC39DRAFT_401719 [Podospora conica]|nr:hypothetical protein QBC39DRAFT_401719 [Schizothecium conicum]